jgi:hypothetical protein
VVGEHRLGRGFQRNDRRVGLLGLAAIGFGHGLVHLARGQVGGVGRELFVHLGAFDQSFSIR